MIRYLDSQVNPKKMMAKYKSPYVIIEVLRNDLFRVQDLLVIQRTQTFYEGVVAIDQMKLYKSWM